jgi:hypothetical protein
MTKLAVGAHIMDDCIYHHVVFRGKVRLLECSRAS